MTVEELRRGREQPQVGYTEFVLAVKRYPTHLFCFFEGGGDPIYYISRIKSVTTTYQTIICGRKSSVIAVNALIAGRREYNGYKTAFFIDRDFNAPLAPRTRPIYETPCYSIENFYTSAAAFKCILTNLFKLSEFSESNPDHDNLLNLYQERQREFHEATLLFNAWYACLIEQREQQGRLIGVQLKADLPKGWVTSGLSGVQQNYTLTTIQQEFPDAALVDDALLQQKIAAFEQADQGNVFRGKYELGFLVKFIRLVLTDSKSKQRAVTTAKINFSFGDASSIGQEQALTVFSACADTPEGLIAYLKLVTT
jgi:hypothetical protein